MEVVLSPELRLCLLVLMGEEGLEARAEDDMPPPEAAERRLGIPVIVSPELTVLAGIILMCHNALNYSFFLSINVIL